MLTLSCFFHLSQVGRACAMFLKGTECVRSSKDVPASRTVAFSLPRGSLISGRPPPRAHIRTRAALPQRSPGSLCSLGYTKCLEFISRYKLFICLTNEHKWTTEAHIWNILFFLYPHQTCKSQYFDINEVVAHDVWSPCTAHLNGYYTQDQPVWLKVHTHLLSEQKTLNLTDYSIYIGPFDRSISFPLCWQPCQWIMHILCFQICLSKFE